MNNDVEISNKFKPLFKLLNLDYHPEIDTVIMTGGRYSLKSYTVAIFSLVALVQHQWNVLYTRYTNLSIVDSVKPEVSDKIELLGLDKYVSDTNTHISTNTSRIAFKGIKTGSSIQTANLKSLTGFNCFVVDEAEEIPDYETFKKVFYSIRSEQKRNLTILILNPTLKSHWIFTEFFEKKGMEGGENCIKDNVLYIHTSYLDADQSRMPKNILADYKRLQIENETEYSNIVLGGWVTEPEGVLLPKSQLKFADLSNIPQESIIFKFAVGDPADVGGDKFSIPFIHCAIIDNAFVCYVKSVIHSKFGIEANTERVIEKLKDNAIEQIWYESNGVGLAAILLLKQKISNHVKLSAFNSTINKEVRIFSHYEFVKRYFVFDINYKSDPEYTSFINDLTQYSKEGDNKNKKDAIDVCCSAAHILKIKYKKFFYE